MLRDNEPRSGWKASTDAWLKLKPAARENRGNAIPAEDRLWQALRKFRSSGFAFRRQHAIGSYIVDFYCSRARLVIEVDGASHDDKQTDDAIRTQFLNTNRLAVLRFQNANVMSNLPSVLAAIRARLEEPPLRSHGEGAGGEV